MKPMSCSRRLTMFECDAEFERDPPHWVRIFEPLRVDAPEDARLSYFGIGEVAFYDKTGNRLSAGRLSMVDTQDCTNVPPGGSCTPGAPVAQWSSILMLRNLKSPETYFQAAFRVQSPWSIKNPNGDNSNE